MSTIRFNATDEQLEDLRKRAKNLNMSVQDYIRMELLGIKIELNDDKIIKCIKENFGNSGDIFNLNKILKKLNINDLENVDLRLYGKRLKKLSQTKIDGRYLFEETDERCERQIVYRTI